MSSPDSSVPVDVSTGPGPGTTQDPVTTPDTPSTPAGPTSPTDTPTSPVDPTTPNTPTSPDTPTTPVSPTSPTGLSSPSTPGGSPGASTPASSVPPASSVASSGGPVTHVTSPSSAGVVPPGSSLPVSSLPSSSLPVSSLPSSSSSSSALSSSEPTSSASVSTSFSTFIGTFIASSSKNDRYVISAPTTFSLVTNGNDPSVELLYGTATFAQPTTIPVTATIPVAIISGSSTILIAGPQKTSLPSGSKHKSSGISGGAIAGIVVGVIAAILLGLLFWFVRVRRYQKRRRERLYEDKTTAWNPSNMVKRVRTPSFDDEPTTASTLPTMTPVHQTMPRNVSSADNDFSSQNPSHWNQRDIESDQLPQTPVQHSDTVHTPPSKTPSFNRVRRKPVPGIE